MSAGTNWARYLIFFQYIGTNYKGAVKAPHEQLKKGVQDHLEDAVRRLKPVNPVSLFVSSRTDAGVHALSNSAHFDLQRRNDKPPFKEQILVQALNQILETEQIRVTRAHRVPDNFSARYRAQSRTYVYRVALGTSRGFVPPITEYNLCWSLSNTQLDVGAMREGAALLVGTHDFSSFRAQSPDLRRVNPVKTLQEADMQPGCCFAQSHFHREVPLLELTFKSKSFLYKQVRRMAGALVGVGQGRISVPRLKEILEARDPLAYPQGMEAPAQGLFLTRVDYREEDLQLWKDPCVSSGKSEG